jgi:hypothetical protein
MNASLVFLMRATCPVHLSPELIALIIILKLYFHLYPCLPNGSFYSRFPSYQSRDSSVGIALGYRQDDRGFRVRFPAGARNFSLRHRVQNSSEAHPSFYPMGTRALSLGVKRLGREANH